jgi:hypothetical protein
MGTRADFWCGKGLAAEWIGSIAYDGYREGIDEALLSAKTEKEFRVAFELFVEDRDDYTAPAQGWPWPWETSATSDCSYWFFDDKVWDAHGCPDHYVPCDVDLPEDEEALTGLIEEGDLVEFPNMKDRQNVTFGARSGLLIITAKGIV